MEAASLDATSDLSELLDGLPEFRPDLTLDDSLFDKIEPLQPLRVSREEQKREKTRERERRKYYRKKVGFVH